MVLGEAGYYIYVLKQKEKAQDEVLKRVMPINNLVPTSQSPKFIVPSLSPNKVSSKWQSILKEELNTHIYESTIERVEFDIQSGEYYYPLLLYFDVEKQLIMSITSGEWQNAKVYEKAETGLLPFDYKKLREGDKIEVRITTAVGNDGVSLPRELVIIKK